jgi:hypothetical protein
LPQIPNRSTIAEVGLVQHGLCVGYATHESLSLGRLIMVFFYLRIVIKKDGAYG